MSGLVIINGYTTPSEGGRPYANGLPSRELNQTRNLLYRGERVAECVREAAVNDETVAGVIVPRFGCDWRGVRAPVLRSSFRNTAGR